MIPANELRSFTVVSLPCAAYFHLSYGYLFMRHHKFIPIYFNCCTFRS